MPRAAAVRLIQYAGRVDLWFAILATVAIGYAFAARWYPIRGDDLFFMLSTARWIVEHGAVPWVDVFSYTAQGQPWIYPVGGEPIVLCVWLIGGYTALSLLAPLGCAGTVALALRKGSLISALLAVLAVPLIASRCMVRGDLFTTVLSAGFLGLLWRYHTTGRARLWLLPVLMILWCNAHVGFFVGLAMIGGYVLVEILELVVSLPTMAAAERLRRAWPWLIATFPATLVNPFGWSIYDGIIRQLTSPQLEWISEWAPVPLNWTMMSTIASPGDFRGTILLVMMIAGAIAAVALWRKQLGAAVLLLAVAVATAGHVRSESLLAIVTVIVGGSVLSSAAAMLPRRLTPTPVPAIGAIIVAIVLAYLRIASWVDDGVDLFATGLSPEFPEHAIDFIERENIPAQILTVNDGAYFTWRLFPGTSTTTTAEQSRLGRTALRVFQA